MDLNNLAEQAKKLSESVPEDIKEKATNFVENQVETLAPDQLKGQAKDLVSGLKGKLGL